MSRPPQLFAPALFLRDALKMLDNNLALTKRLPRMIRVRRRGFPASVRRGSRVMYQGKSWEVARRGLFSLWLSDYPESVGDTVHIRWPKRFAA